MPIIRVPKNSSNPFFMMDNNTMNNSKLSLQAAAILTYLISKPDNWHVRVSDIVSHFTNGECSVRSAMKELVAAGYLVHKRVRLKNGHMLRYDYTVHENPFISNPNINKLRKDNPKPLHENRQVETRKHSNTHKKKEATTASVVLPDNAVADSSPPDIKISSHQKEKLITKLHNLKITSHKKLFELFALPDILKYSTWIEHCNRLIKNPTGFLITAIREKWLDDIEETQKHNEDRYHWYKCPGCSRDIGFLSEMPHFTICQKCKNELKESRFNGGFCVTN